MWLSNNIKFLKRVFFILDCRHPADRNYAYYMIKDNTLLKYALLKVMIINQWTK